MDIIFYSFDKKKMSYKGSVTTSDYLDFDFASRKSFAILNDDKNFRMGFLILLGINSGMRIRDLLNVSHKDLQGESFRITESKTQKNRVITINESVKKGYKILLDKLGTSNQIEDDKIFISQKGCVYTVRSINRKLKEIFPSRSKNISSHSLRKTFGRRVFITNSESQKSLIFLSAIFNHSSENITRTYLGIRAEELSDIYLNL